MAKDYIYDSSGMDGARLEVQSHPDGGTVNVGIVYCDDTHGYENSPDALWMDLSREGINRTIRALRKARDRSYGADA